MNYKIHAPFEVQYTEHDMFYHTPYRSLPEAMDDFNQAVSRNCQDIRLLCHTTLQYHNPQREYVTGEEGDTEFGKPLGFTNRSRSIPGMTCFTIGSLREGE